MDVNIRNLLNKNIRDIPTGKDVALQRLYGREK